MRRAALFICLLAATVATGTAHAAEPEIETVVAGADFPTNMTFGPSGSLYYTEKNTGLVREVDDHGELLDEPVARFDVTSDGETGLLGIASYEDWLYVYLSDAQTQTNRIVRFSTDDPSAPEDVAELLPTTAGYHNGGDLAIGPDGMLYATVGEMHEPDLAQDPDSLGGKIVRLTPEGEVPAGAPFGDDNPAWSMGHRNSFGICFDFESGLLYETENGPDAHDEVNVIDKGGNYGWPDVMGPGGEPEFIDPLVDFPDIVAPTGCSVWGHTLWFGDFTGNLYRLPLPAEAPATPEVVAQLPGGITDVARGPGDALYIATQDGIYRLAVAPPAGRTASAAPSPIPSPEPTGKRTLSMPAVVASVLALLLVLAGGWWFARIRTREEAEGDAEEAAEAGGEDPSRPDA